jgi:hypothetical protein
VDDNRRWRSGLGRYTAGVTCRKSSPETADLNGRPLTLRDAAKAPLA